jgi:hypothetical protein
VRSSIPDLSGAIRSLSGHSTPLGDLMRFAAVYLVFAAALIALLMWLQRDGLRTCVAAGLAAVLAAVITAPLVRSGILNGSSHGRISPP